MTTSEPPSTGGCAAPNADTLAGSAASPACGVTASRAAPPDSFLFDLPSTSSAADTRVSRSRVPARNVAALTSGGDGPGSQTSFARYDPGTSSWRTSQLSFETLTHSGACLVIWLSACAFGAPHTRERLFLVAHAVGELRPTRLAEKQRRLGPTPLRQVSDGQHAWGRPALWVEAASASDRVADGTASRMVAAGGNAVVPQVAEHIGRLIVDAETAPREMEAAG
jgi:hypothetical protein